MSICSRILSTRSLSLNLWAASSAVVYTRLLGLKLARCTESNTWRAVS